jgi:hypothetical protein
MANWFVTIEGKERGPLTDAQLRQLARSGRLQRFDLVRREGSDRNLEAVQLKGLFEPFPAKTLPPPPLSTAPVPSAPTFTQWYGSAVGTWPMLLQVMAWLFYGFIWIPIWYGISINGAQATRSKFPTKRELAEQIAEGRRMGERVSDSANEHVKKLVTKGRVVVAVICFIFFLGLIPYIADVRDAARRKSYDSSITRQSAASPTADNVLQHFDETPLPVHVALGHGGKKVWKLDGGGVGDKSETYVIFNSDGKLDDLIFKDQWSGVEAKAFFPERSESKVTAWSRGESAADSGVSWMLENYSDEGFTIVGRLRTSSASYDATTTLTIKAAVDLDQGKGKWERVETLDIDYKGRSSGLERNVEPKRTHGNVRLLTYRADGFYN